MSDQENELTQPQASAEAAGAETTLPEQAAVAAAPPSEPELEPKTAEPAAAPAPTARNEQPPRAVREGKPRGDKPERGPNQRQERPPREGKPAGDRPERGERGERRDRPQGQGGGRPFNRDAGRGGRPELAMDIDLERLVNDSLYLDNQAHAIVSRMRDMDSGTRSQLRRLYSAVRRACRAAETDRQHQFVMLRARLAYTIARHQLRSLDMLEKLLLQVTRKNDPRGYERFRDLFEAIVAYNE